MLTWTFIKRILTAGFILLVNPKPPFKKKTLWEIPEGSHSSVFGPQTAVLLQAVLG